MFLAYVFYITVQVCSSSCLKCHTNRSGYRNRIVSNKQYTINGGSGGGGLRGFCPRGGSRILQRGGGGGLEIRKMERKKVSRHRLWSQLGGLSPQSAPPPPLDPPLHPPPKSKRPQQQPFCTCNSTRRLKCQIR